MNGQPYFQQVSIDGITVSISHLKHLVQECFANATKLMKDLTFSNKLVRFDLTNATKIFDENHNKTIAFNFLQHPNNSSFGTLSTSLLKTSSFHKNLMNNDEVAFNLSSVTSWLAKADNILKDILVLIHILSGQPCRATGNFVLNHRI